MTVQPVSTTPALCVSTAGDPGDDPQAVRLRGLSRQQLEERLIWLSWYNLAAYTAVMDYMDFCDSLAADTNPDAGELEDPEPAPFCRQCGAQAGIFWALGTEWQHYRPGAGANDNPLVYDPGHSPIIGWRIGGVEVPAPAA